MIDTGTILIQPKDVIEDLQFKLARPPTSEEITDFMHYLEIDCVQWIKDNVESWIDSKEGKK